MSRLRVGLVALLAALLAACSGDSEPDEAGAPAPTEANARATVQYLNGAGRPLVGHEDAAADVVRLPAGATESDCGSVTEKLDAAGRPPEVLEAIAAVRDPVLRELLVGEHAALLSVVGACAEADRDAFDALVSDARRRHDAVTARHQALEAKAR